MKTFIIEQAKLYKISNGVRISVMSYNNISRTYLAVGQDTEIEAVQRALEKVTKTNSPRQAEQALKSVKDLIQNGRDGVRKEAGKVVVLLIAGRNERSGFNELRKEAEDLRRVGADIAVIAIGSDVNEDEIKSAVATPGEIVRVPTADRLKDATANISDAASSAQKMSEPVDIGFVIGASGPSADKDFTLGKDVIIDMLKKMDVSHDKTLVGLVLYGQDARIVLRFDMVNNMDDAVRAIKGLRIPGEGYALEKAIGLSQRDLFSELYGARRGIPKALVILLNMNANSAEKSQVERIKADGVKVVVVSLGKNVADDTTKDVATSSKDFVKVSSKDDLRTGAKKAVSSLLQDPCLNVKCEFSGKCNKRADRTTECICPICDSGSKTQAICGSDGKTYASYCHLKSASCKMKRTITVIKDEPCGITRPVDVFYLIDSSKYVSSDTLKEMKDFVIEQGNVYNVSRDGVRISVMSYSDTLKTYLAVGQGVNMDLVKGAVGKVTESSKPRNVEKALKSMKDVIQNGRDGVRKEAGKVVVLLIAGRNERSGFNELRKEAGDLRRVGADIAVIAIGSDVNKDEIKSVVATPSEIVRVPTADRLNTVTANISDRVSGAQLMSDPLDLGFVIGASEPSADKDFKLGKYFMKEILKKLDVSPDKSRVGLIVFGSDARIVFRLDTVRDKDNAIRAIEGLRMPGNGNALEKAIGFSRTYMFSELYGARRGIPKTLVVLTNKNSNSAEKSEVDKLKTDGVKVVVVSLGKNVVDETTKTLATSSKDFVKVSSKDDLRNVIKEAVSSLLPDTCLNVKCLFNGKCYSRPDRTTECICPICDSGSKTQAICGSDGKTYASYCHLKSASCKTKKKITVIKDEPCGVTKPVDIFYLIDNSKYVPSYTLKKMKDFVVEQRKIYNVSKDGVRISVMSYSDTLKTYLAVGQGVNMDFVKGAVGKVTESSKPRHVEKALKSMKEVIQNGRDGVRKEAGKVVVLLIAGGNERSGFDELRKEAEDLRRVGADIAVIAIGSDVNEDEIKSAVATPGEIVRVPTADRLKDATANISDRVSGAQLISDPLDLGFVIGASGPSADKDFEMGKDVVKEIVKKLDVATDKNRVGLIVFGSDARIVFRLDTVREKDNAIRAIEGLRMPGDGNALEKAIGLSRRYMFSELYGARRGIPKTLVILMNKNANSAERSEVDKLKTDGVRVLVVSLGKNVVDETTKHLATSSKDFAKVSSKNDVRNVIKEAVSSLLPDPCLNVKCEFNGKCYIRPDRTIECICPICDTDSKTQAICGSDGKTYASYCHLKSASCNMKKKITVIKDEPCAPTRALNAVKNMSPNLPNIPNIANNLKNLNLPHIPSFNKSS
eukprot:Seg1649.2 transcript_id=Seg1649.2/GoldUCD/mRNA.D3Y31 product="Collagen alpha-4 chain" protein_id=Seg1649.2/GoldUCD/D3Y31